ncbi:MAG: toll/interleukin-1 receptor domain-containing protein [Verrucomicrobiae bacterium]|nr:toll/interleukin-1 receptor domain-containing protein [Verrucomicrobiae bacterium]
MLNQRATGFESPGPRGLLEPAGATSVAPTDVVNAPEQSRTGARAAGDALSVFISYSRDDLAFADQLVAALKLYGFDPTIDRHGISGGEAWQQRLGGLILEADTVVFVLSPSSARSEMCAWEVDEATRLGKRILPVLPYALGDATAPEKLRDRNYVMFYPEPRAPGSGFGAGLTSLVAALERT